MAKSTQQHGLLEERPVNGQLDDGIAKRYRTGSVGQQERSKPVGLLLILGAGLGERACLLQPQQCQQSVQARPEQHFQRRLLAPEHDEKYQAGQYHQQQRKARSLVEQACSLALLVDLSAAEGSVVLHGHGGLSGDLSGFDHRLVLVICVWSSIGHCSTSR
jgi:hypothetical protein